MTVLFAGGPSGGADVSCEHMIFVVISSILQKKMKWTCIHAAQLLK